MHTHIRKEVMLSLLQQSTRYNLHKSRVQTRHPFGSAFLDVFGLLLQMDFQ